MPYYQSINGRKYEYADEQPAGFKPIAPGKFPLFGAKDFGDIIARPDAALLKQYARLLSRDRGLLSPDFGAVCRQLLNNIKPGDLLQPVKIVKVGTYCVVVFNNGVSLMANYLEAVLNHPDMTIHGVSGGSHHLALMVEGEVVGVVAGATYTPEHADTLWEASQA